MRPDDKALRALALKLVALLSVSRATEVPQQGNRELRDRLGVEEKKVILKWF